MVLAAHQIHVYSIGITGILLISVLVRSHWKTEMLNYAATSPGFRSREALPCVLLICSELPVNAVISVVLWHRWKSDRKGILPVKLTHQQSRKVLIREPSGLAWRLLQTNTPIRPNPKQKVEVCCRCCRRYCSCSCSHKVSGMCTEIMHGT